MKQLCCLCLLLVGLAGFSQDTITTAVIKDYVGRDVWVKGKVASVKMPSDDRAPAYINVDKGFPNNVFTIAIAPKYAERMKIKLDALNGKQILVKGKVVVGAKSGSTIPQMFNPSKIVVTEDKPAAKPDPKTKTKAKS
jgi:hypothetical protein